MTAMPVNSSAQGALRMDARRSKKLRSFVTPEGVDLRLEIASAGSRLAALMIDYLLLIIITIVVLLILGVASIGDNVEGSMSILAMLFWFMMNNFWFAMFELGPRAATPGKRLVGIRVVARDGGQLTVPAVVARNLVRQIEFTLPMMFMFGESGDAASVATRLFGLMWTVALAFFLLFNRDRMRLGDIIAGTWVVQARHRTIAVDMASAPLADSPGAPVFSEAELAVYGVYELQELERVLRQNDRDTMIAVADAIRAKIDRHLQEDDRLFLISYYRQLKARQERNLLFGKRRANKYEAPT